MIPTAYDRYYANKLESALVYQDYVVDQMLSILKFPVTIYSSARYQRTVGEGAAGAEIKHDELYANTGNLWIEVAEKARPRDGDYVPSGIYRDNNSWLYIIGDYDTIFVFAISTLRAIAARAEERGEIRENKTKTSRAVLLRDAVARNLAIRVLAPKADQKIVIAVGDLHELGRHLHRVAIEVENRKHAPPRLPFDDENS